MSSWGRKSNAMSTQHNSQKLTKKISTSFKIKDGEWNRCKIKQTQNSNPTSHLRANVCWRTEEHSYLSFISEARIQYDIFYNPQAQRTGGHPHTSKPHTNTASLVCVIKTWKNHTDLHTYETAPRKKSPTQRKSTEKLYTNFCTHTSKSHSYIHSYKEVMYVWVSAVCPHKG